MVQRRAAIRRETHPNSPIRRRSDLQFRWAKNSFRAYAASLALTRSLKPRRLRGVKAGLILAPPPRVGAGQLGRNRFCQKCREILFEPIANLWLHALHKRLAIIGKPFLKHR